MDDGKPTEASTGFVDAYKLLTGSEEVFEELFSHCSHERRFTLLVQTTCSQHPNTLHTAVYEISSVSLYPLHDARHACLLPVTSWPRGAGSSP